MVRLQPEEEGEAKTANNDTQENGKGKVDGKGWQGKSRAKMVAKIVMMTRGGGSKAIERSLRLKKEVLGNSRMRRRRDGGNIKGGTAGG